MKEFTITLNDLILGVLALLWIIYSIWAMRRFRTNLINKEGLHTFVEIYIAANISFVIAGIIYVVLKYGNTVIL